MTGTRPNFHLRLEGIEKTFGQNRILSGVSLEARQGEFIALVGPSGCGKSTLLRIAAGLEEADRGRVLIGGADVTEMRAADRDLAMVFQSYALYPHLTARQNMALPLMMRRLGLVERLPLLGRFSPRRAAKLADISAEVEKAAASLKIGALLDRKPGQMSGGQRQRVALGRALVRRPQAFLMDEPLSNLDASLRVHMRSEIVDLHKRVGVTTLYVTHDQEEALSMADRVAIMLGGRLLQLATPTEVYSAPGHIEIARFIGSPRINLIPADVIEGGQAAFRGHRLLSGLSARQGSKVILGIRPENARIERSEAPGSLPVKVLRSEFLGAEALVYCRAEGLDEALIARLTPNKAESFEPGLSCFFLPKALLAFDEGGARLAMADTSNRMREDAA